MTPILFIYARQFGNARFFPGDDKASALVVVAGRKCFNLIQLLALHDAGFALRLKDQDTNAELTFEGYIALMSSIKGAV